MQTPSPPLTSPLTLRVATLNCLNLALPARRVYDMPPYSPDEYLAKTQWLASMFDRLSADFVLLQEVFHAQAVSDVLQQTASQGKAWNFAVPAAADDNTKPRVGLAWRVQWAPQIESIAEFPESGAVAVPEMEPHAAFSRPVLRARVPLHNGLTLTLINVHLKSRRPDYADGESEDNPAHEARAQLRALIKRGAEAVALRRLVTESTHGARTPLIVAGDFNDDARSVTTQIVADTSWRADDRAQRDRMLFNALDVEQRLAPGRNANGHDWAYTILHAGEPERIDHVFVSEEFVPQSKNALGHVASVEILNDHLTERRRQNRASSADALDLTRIYSDHAAVCVSIVLALTR